MLYHKRIIRFTAKVMLCTLLLQLIVPAVQTFALTSGPSQPEVQSFEPVGTTDMVDLFSGDFVYNIPLMDVEGYPINISYHGGVDMEQEASWVGLGWNINPGVINRTVRGLPDDFNGDVIGKELHIKDEKNINAGLGGSMELGGADDLLGANVSADISINFSNYRGVSANIGLSADANVAGMVSAGVNMGVGSQSGADVDLYGGIQFSTSKIIGGDVGAGCGFNIGSGYNSRTGLKDLNYGFSVSVSSKYGGAGVGLGHATVPIGVKNIVPVITNASTMSMVRGRIKIGAEFYGTYTYANLHGSFSKIKYDPVGDMPGYGYLYAQNGNEHSIMDFTRDKDGMFNKTMKLLPLGNMTYDIYGVSGQGTGGSFRPFRNDFGSVFDPVVSSLQEDQSYELEFGAGNLFEAGVDVTLGSTDITSGPWGDYQRPFSQKQPGSIYENTYFKQAGEATETNPGLLAALQGLAPMDGVASVNMPLKKPGSENLRDARGNLIYYFTADEASKYGVASSGTTIKDYTSSNGFGSGVNTISQDILRTSNGRKGSQISEIVQVQTDGRRYVYGIPAMNTSQDEVTFATNSDGSATGLVPYIGNGNNQEGRDKYFSKTHTPAYAHSYLLTSVLSTDYVDIKGDGVTDDDFGSFTKFNYSRKNAGFGWKSPYGKAGANQLAQYNQGFKADKQDNRGNYIMGSKELWMLHSVETKNFVAEFYTSARKDARGVTPSSDISYKLDSIKLYNKHERLINPSAAVPVKTVMFSYDYSLCQGVPNNMNVLNNTHLDDAGNNAPDSVVRGKLTLKRIYVRYGNSQRSMLSPYQFTYAANKAYTYAKRDRWGGYSESGSTEYPYVNQNDPNLDENASAWSLNKITLPSGGSIALQYEADDYAYVMDKPAMEMFRIAGTGKSANFSSGNQLYTNKNNPNLFLYFNRRQSSENPGLPFRDNYFKGGDLIYYNADTRIVGNSYEPIKGYAKVVNIDVCPNDATKGFVELAPQEVTGGGASLNPISYTGINFARYYLPHIIFPGSDPDNSDFMNIIAGLHYAINELANIMENPVRRLTEEGKAQDINTANSYIRLTSPGLKKKGGGQRVKSIQFFDHWHDLAGGNAQDASYGKVYDYTTKAANGSGAISSGVASYEPMIGGDENPFRMPLDYVVQSGGSFPPHDPIGLYQELPIGESLFPGASVGYSRVTVKSIHQQQGRSSQGVDIYDFYTAKDFPVKVASTPLNKLTDIDDKTLLTQKQVFEASQGYTLTFNDMHGKQKRTEHRIIKPSTGTSELISYKEYNYFTTGGQLDGNVPVVVFDAASGKMKKQNKTLGLEADITVDTREKKEEARSETHRVNLNVFLVGIFPVPVPWFYYQQFNTKNEFRSVVATKVVQQYGILKEVISSEEGAITTVRNEAFDPVTGQALITSVNNEYNDHEFSVNYPAYWGYKSMGPSYQNTGYTENFAEVEVANYQGELPTGPTCSYYRVGDELSISYILNGVSYTNNVWVTGFKQEIGNNAFATYCYAPNSNSGFEGFDTVNIHVEGNFLGFPHPIVKPRYKYQDSWPGQNVNGAGILKNVSVKVIRSGAKNQLNESIQNYTGMDQPFDGNSLLKDDLIKLINISAREFSDSLTAILPQYDSLSNPSYWDSLNEYVNGTRQIKRVSKEYAYIKNRGYQNATSRSAGLFSAKGLWNNSTSVGNAYQYIDSIVYCRGILDTITGTALVNNNTGYDSIPPFLYHITGYYPIGNLANSAIYNSYLQPYPLGDPNWVVARTVTKYSPWGFELENKDAIGNYTAALYGYNQQLPMALAQNARQQEVMFDGFEDYSMLQVINNLAAIGSSGFSAFFNLTDVSNSNDVYKKYKVDGTASMPRLAADTAHTGKYSLKTPPGAVSINVDLLSAFATSGQPRYAPFAFLNGRQYIMSCWIRPAGISSLDNYYTPPTGMYRKSNIIEGWQQMEMVFTASATNHTISLPSNTYIDDIRIYPKDANMKSFVYHPVNQKLIATLDENNFATFYEYDQEGNLVRTKKETEKGIMTVMESRSANVKGVQ